MSYVKSIRACPVVQSHFCQDNTDFERQDINRQTDHDWSALDKAEVGLDQFKLTIESTEWRRGLAVKMP